MNAIMFTKVLLYCDGPQIVEAKDEIGGYYIALLVDDVEGRDRFLICGVRPQSLRSFRVGHIDLRRLILERPTLEWGLFTVDDDTVGSLLHPEVYTESIEEGFLPDSGFFLNELSHDVDDAAIKAHERNNLVLELVVEPPESAVGHRIHAETLAGLLVNFQRLIKHSYKRVIRSIPAELRSFLNRSDGHIMDVFMPAAAGSFAIWLESTDQEGAVIKANLLQESPLYQALDIVNEFFSCNESTSDTLRLARRYKGHLSGSYLRLLSFLKEANTGLEYSWATPHSLEKKFGKVSIDQVGRLVAALSGVSNLGIEEIELRGQVDKADSTGRSWRLRDGTTVYTGSVKDDGPDLDGIVIGDRYVFRCLERIESIEGTGKEQRSLYLVEREKLEGASND
jgi:hypothetical protein